MIIPVTDIHHPGVSPYASLTEAQLRSRKDASEAMFIAESPKVITVALDAGYVPVSLLCERRHITGDAAPIIERCPEMPVYCGEREVLASLTGYTLTRGVLCAMRRQPERTAAEVCAGASRVAVIDAVMDSTNIGAIFRSAAALGIDAVLLTRNTCEPLNRRVVRVSMGAVFKVPWAWIDDPNDTLHTLGFKTVAMALRHDSVSLDSPRLTAEPRLAVIMGNEGDGLPASVIAGADYVARIPMARGVDSLNVSVAAGIAFWQLRSPAQPDDDNQNHM